VIATKVDERRRPPVELAEHDAYGTLGLDPDPEIGFLA
jgi:hypothetical protein